MSLYNDASLVMIPSAYKDGKLYSIKPTDGSGDFTFSRGSNLAATRVDENGLIEKGRENLLTYSNDFAAGWANVTSTETGGQSGYDGSNDAWLLTKTAANGRVYDSFSTSGVQTFSIYAKANDLNWLRLSTLGSFTTNCYFNLSDGTLGIALNVIDSNIESVGGGWYRCSLTFNDSSSNILVYPADGDGDVSGTSGSIYIQDAQLEAGLVATDYIETTTTTAQAGILEDMPRLDYSGGASCPALLLEPTRTNLVPHSEYFSSGSGWTNQNIDYPISNVSTSPDGLNNASLLSGGTTSGVAFRYIFRTITSSTTNTFSFFAKKKTGSGNIWLLGKNNNTFAYYNLTNGTADSATSGMTIDIEDYGDGWYRCYFTQDYTSSFAYSIGIGVCVESGTPNYDASINPLQEIYIYGAQFESGSYPTSYIPCYGAATTRSGDFINEQISGLTSLEQGTFFLDFNRGVTSATSRDASNDGFFYRSTSSFPSGDAIEIATEPDGRTRLALRLSSFTSIYLNNTLSRYKMLVKWEGTSVKAYVNGVLEYSSATKWGDATSALEYIGYRGDFRKSVNQVATFPTALTDSEAIALTTL